MDATYLAEMQAVRRSVYAGLPGGPAIMAAVDAHAPRQPVPARPVAARAPVDPVQAVLAQYDLIYRPSASKAQGRGALRANMARQLRRDGIEPKA